MISQTTQKKEKKQGNKILQYYGTNSISEVV